MKLVIDFEYELTKEEFDIIKDTFKQKLENVA